MFGRQKRNVEANADFLAKITWRNIMVNMLQTEVSKGRSKHRFRRQEHERKAGKCAGEEAPLVECEEPKAN